MVLGVVLGVVGVVPVFGVVLEVVHVAGVFRQLRGNIRLVRAAPAIGG